jgi:hypothetical protein
MEAWHMALYSKFELSCVKLAYHLRYASTHLFELHNSMISQLCQKWYYLDFAFGSHKVHELSVGTSCSTYNFNCSIGSWNN